jgi:hypothetical protein
VEAAGALCATHHSRERVFWIEVAFPACYNGAESCDSVTAPRHRSGKAFLC